jgi:hypothetical protein
VKQQSLASQAVFERYGRKSRRELFLDEMEQVVPWSGLQSLVEPHYANAGNGRRPVGLGIMLRAYFVQQWFNLSDPGVEEALYESAALRRFVGVDLGVAPAPDETTISRFLANCVIHYNACVLSLLLRYAEDKKDLDLADRIKRISPVSWKHINFYGEYPSGIPTRSSTSMRRSAVIGPREKRWS